MYFKDWFKRSEGFEDLPSPRWATSGVAPLNLTEAPPQVAAFRQFHSPSYAAEPPPVDGCVRMQSISSTRSSPVAGNVRSLRGQGSQKLSHKLRPPPSRSQSLPVHRGKSCVPASSPLLSIYPVKEHTASHHTQQVQGQELSLDNQRRTTEATPRASEPVASNKIERVSSEERPQLLRAKKTGVWTTIVPVDPNETENEAPLPPIRKLTKRPTDPPPGLHVVNPFGSLGDPEAIPPEFPATEFQDASTAQTQGIDASVSNPTCSLNLVCYTRGCRMSQIRVTLRSKFDFDEAYEQALSKTPALIATDRELFEALRRHYLRDICGFWRRFFSLKTLRRFRLLTYTATTRPIPVPMDEYTMREVLYAYNHPSELGSETAWIEWVFRLRQPHKRHALEFVEGWNGTRIAIAGTVPCILSTLVGVIWSARGGDIQTAFTVASFILTLATVLLALLAVISGIDSRAR